MAEECKSRRKGERGQEEWKRGVQSREGEGEFESEVERKGESR